jgi:hypothetical protein
MVTHESLFIWDRTEGHNTHIDFILRRNYHHKNNYLVFMVAKCVNVQNLCLNAYYQTPLPDCAYSERLVIVRSLSQ